MTEQLISKLESKNNRILYVSACPAWIKYAEQFMPEILPDLSDVKCPQQIAGALIKTLVADQTELKPEKIFSVSATPCTAMKFEARRDGMMRKGISDIDSVLTIRELGRLIRLYGIDVTNTDSEPADPPMEGCSSCAALSEVTGGLAEGIIRSLFSVKYKRDVDKQLIKKFRTGGSFREVPVNAEQTEIKVAVVDGLTGLEKLKASIQAGKSYDLVEVMVCPGGCINGAGMPFRNQKDDRKNLIKMIYQADENDAIGLPEKSPVIINLYNKLIKDNNEISDRKIFHTHYIKRNVLL
jgi:iron only hydrogenase large subunit-like protein